MTPDTWRLEMTADPYVEDPIIKLPAKIDKPLTLADSTALDLPTLLESGKTRSVKYIKAMQCLNIPAPLGQGLWEVVPLRDVLEFCGSMLNVRRIYYWGYHNNDPKQIFQSSVSYTQAMETPPGELPVFLAYKLNGKPIPPIRGGPVRMIVPWSHGFKSVKWIQHIYLTNDYGTNDTYALKNNDPESNLKTAAYTEELPEQIQAGQSITVTGQVISGISGLNRVEYWLREVDDESKSLAYDDPNRLHMTIPSSSVRHGKLARFIHNRIGNRSYLKALHRKISWASNQTQVNPKHGHSSMVWDSGLPRSTVSSRVTTK
jgi:DMSO/TMAO reductase YedYZ molybdopterin-dependent catalytic subunit